MKPPHRPLAHHGAHRTYNWGLRGLVGGGRAGPFITKRVLPGSILQGGGGGFGSHREQACGAWRAHPLFHPHQHPHSPTSRPAYSTTVAAMRAGGALVARFRECWGATARAPAGLGATALLPVCVCVCMRGWGLRVGWWAAALPNLSLSVCLLQCTRAIPRG